MDVLFDSPQLEALFFNLSLSLDFFNSLWNWLAVLTVGISAWGIKNIGYQYQSHDHGGSPFSSEHLQTEEEGANHQEPNDNHELLRHGSCERCPSTSGSTCGYEYDQVDGITKGEKFKFTMYLEEDNGGGVTDDEGVVVNGVSYVREEVCTTCMPWDWEVRFVQRDLGWYRCQDLTALNGSVVKLWEGEGGEW